MVRTRLALAPGRLARAVGKSGALVGGGIVAWSLYEAAASLGRQGQIQTSAGNDSDPKYLYLPPGVADRFKLDPIDAAEELRSMLPKHVRKPWKLLRQANWGDRERHVVAVKELSRLQLSDGEAIQVAQSCQLRTAVGLARTKDAGGRLLFLPPPPLPTSVAAETTPRLFERLLSRLRRQDLHECIASVTDKALQSYVPGTDDDHIMDSDLDFEFQRDSHHLPVLPRQRYSEKSVIEFCLHALLSHSTIHSHCIEMIRHHCLPIFVKVISEHPNSPRIKSLIGKILANVAIHPETHKDIFTSGFVGILAQWKSDPNLLVTLPATKALCNMDQEFGDIYDPGVYLLLPQNRLVRHLNQLSDWGVDVVFIHGLLGGVFYTWRQLDEANERGWGTTELVSTPEYSYCWPRDWLAGVSDHVRVVGVDFDTYLSQWGNSCPSESFKTSLEDRSLDILEKLKRCGIGRRPVIFVSHSMGGLIVKKMLAHAHANPDEEERQLALNTRGVVFYSTPHSGSRVAKLNSYSKYLFFPSTEVQDLEADSPQLDRLHQSFTEVVKSRDTNIEVISFGETVPTPYMGIDFTFVPPESSDPGLGKYYKVAMNHMNICKPANESSVLFRKFYRLLWNTLDEVTPFE